MQRVRDLLNVRNESEKSNFSVSKEGENVSKNKQNFLEELARRSEQEGLEKDDRLSPEERAILKDTLGEFQAKLQNKYKELGNEDLQKIVETACSSLDRENSVKASMTPQQTPPSARSQKDLEQPAR